MGILPRLLVIVFEESEHVSEGFISSAWRTDVGLVVESGESRETLIPETASWADVWHPLRVTVGDVSRASLHFLLPFVRVGERTGSITFVILHRDDV